MTAACFTLWASFGLTRCGLCIKPRQGLHPDQRDRLATNATVQIAAA
jgi:hypothetical protein